MSPQDLALWRHHPVTEVFLQFLADQAANWRDLAAELVVSGQFDPTAKHEDLNPNVVRGKILAVEALQELSIEGIQGFYADQQQASED